MLTSRVMIKPVLTVCCALLALACTKQDGETTPPEPTPQPEPVATTEPEEAEPEPEPEPEDQRTLQTRACDEEGKAELCTALAVKWEKGQEGPQDLTKAREYYAKGCDGGHTIGCFNLALMLQTDAGGAPDQAKAVALFQQVCDGLAVAGEAKADDAKAEEADAGGDAAASGAAEAEEACFNAAVALEGGQGVTADKPKARELYQKICDGGNQVGCVSVGRMAMLGDGGDKERKKARTLFNAACEAGEMTGCYFMSLALDKGVGGKRSPKKAKQFKQRACDGGYQPACAKK